jgi:hypothetical protein
MRSASALRFSKGCSSLNFERMLSACAFCGCEVMDGKMCGDGLWWVERGCAEWRDVCGRKVRSASGERRLCTVRQTRGAQDPARPPHCTDQHPSLAGAGAAAHCAFAPKTERFTGQIIHHQSRHPWFAALCLVPRVTLCCIETTAVPE